MDENGGACGPPTSVRLDSARELSSDFFTRRLGPERETRRLIARLEALSHQVSLQPPDQPSAITDVLHSSGHANSPSTASAHSASVHGLEIRDPMRTHSA